jgi:hypothetical protein
MNEEGHSGEIAANDTEKGKEREREREREGEGVKNTKDSRKLHSTIQKPCSSSDGEIKRNNVHL